MGNSNSASGSRGEDGKTLPKKNKGGILCACGKGRDDNDEEVSTDRFGNSQRLTEEEWAAVKTGRLHAQAGPDLMQEAGDGLAPPVSRKSKSKRKSEENKGAPVDDGADPAPPIDESKLRFKVGDRVKCVCKKWGNDFESGSIIKVGYREDSWPLSKPTAPYQVKLDKGALVFAPDDSDEFVQPANEEWASQLPPGAPWYLQPGALDRELAKVGAYT